MIASRSIETRNLAKCCVKDGSWSSRGDESRHPEGVSLRFMRGKGRKGETRRCAPVLANFAPSRARGLPRMKTRTDERELVPTCSLPIHRSFSLSLSLVSRKRNTPARVYAHLYDGRRPTVATTVIHDHVDLTNASTSAREYVFIGLYTATRLYACISHPGMVPSSTLSVVPLPFLFLPSSSSNFGPDLSLE